MEEDTKNQRKEFKVGDKVWSFHYGVGIVIRVNDNLNSPYPITVRWTDNARSPNTCDYFTKEGHFYMTAPDAKRDITFLSSKEESDMGVSESKEESQNTFAVGDRVNDLIRGNGTIVQLNPKYGTIVVDFDAEGEVEIVPEEINKVEYTAVNPAHYQVAGIPEAIEIMQGLMTKEQFEGFLWGNIIKYAYRYGRKGDKAATAGKIAWYANKLKELEEEGERK